MIGPLTEAEEVRVRLEAWRRINWPELRAICGTNRMDPLERDDSDATKWLREDLAAIPAEVLEDILVALEASIIAIESGEPHEWIKAGWRRDDAVRAMALVARRAGEEHARRAAGGAVTPVPVTPPERNAFSMDFDIAVPADGAVRAGPGVYSKRPREQRRPGER